MLTFERLLFLLVLSRLSPKINDPPRKCQKRRRSEDFIHESDDSDWDYSDTEKTDEISAYKKGKIIDDGDK